jgi:hypothetical protein
MTLFSALRDPGGYKMIYSITLLVISVLVTIGLVIWDARKRAAMMKLITPKMVKQASKLQCYNAPQLNPIDIDNFQGRLPDELV